VDDVAAAELDVRLLTLKEAALAHAQVPCDSTPVARAA
jgi:hypothetical protein